MGLDRFQTAHHSQRNLAGLFLLLWTFELTANLLLWKRRREPGAVTYCSGWHRHLSSGQMLFRLAYRTGRRQSRPSRSTNKSGKIYYGQRQTRSTHAVSVDRQHEGSPASNRSGRAGHTPRHRCCPRARGGMSATLRPPYPAPQGAGAEQTCSATRLGDPPATAARFPRHLSGHRSA